MDRNASISQQAQNLKRSLENRQQRRQADKFQRQQESQDVYESRQASSTQPGAASLASLAAISALPAVQQEVIRCELCQANFLTDASWKQHIEGPVHRKALERQEAERVRHERMRQSGLNDVAEMALGAAGWHSQWSADQGRASSSRQPSSRPAGSAPAQTHARPPQHQQQGRTSAHGLSIRQQQQRQHEQHLEQLRRQGEIMSHEQVLSAVRHEEEEVPNIDGWVPPGIAPSPAAPLTAPPELPHRPSPSRDQREPAAAAASAAAQVSHPLPHPLLPVAAAAASKTRAQCRGTYLQTPLACHMAAVPMVMMGRQP